MVLLWDRAKIIPFIISNITLFSGLYGLFCRRKAVYEDRYLGRITIGEDHQQPHLVQWGFCDIRKLFYDQEYLKQKTMGVDYKMLAQGVKGFSVNFPGGRELKIGIRDLLGAPVDVIVNPANSGLSHGGGVAAQISKEAGPALDLQCERIIKNAGRVPVTQNVFTTAGHLSYKAIVHAVGPRMGDGNEQKKIEDTIINCLTKAEIMEWSSIAFPAISAGLFCVPVDISAKAFKTAITSYWESNITSVVTLIWICLTVDTYSTFKRVFDHK